MYLLYLLPNNINFKGLTVYCKVNVHSIVETCNKPMRKQA